MFKKSTELILKRTSSINKLPFYSTVPQPVSEERLQSFRTVQNDPLKHTSENIGQFYTIPQDDKKQLFSHGGLPKSFNIQTKTFNETCVMIRQPSIDLINCLKAIDYSKPAVRFVLYGKKGAGKTLSLSHVLHYAFKDNFLLVHVPWVGNWMRRCKEASNSETKEGHIDLNLDAAAWLVHFKSQNAHLLTNPELKTSQDHVWSKRENTPKESPLIELIDHGINRVKYASRCVVAVANEIKNLSNNGVCKTLVAIDGYNAFFNPRTRVYTEKKEMVHPHKITLTEAFLNLSKFDWKNSAIILIVDQIAVSDEDQESHFPRYLLGKDGFEHVDPFVPVVVNNYSSKEIKSCLDYYRDRKWLQSDGELDQELTFISAGNPYKLMQICAPL